MGAIAERPTSVVERAEVKVASFYDVVYVALNPFPAVGPETGPTNRMIVTHGPSQSYDCHTNDPETDPASCMIVTRSARKRARDTFFYRALLTSAVANYKVSTYFSGLQQ